MLKVSALSMCSLGRGYLRRTKPFIINIEILLGIVWEDDEINEIEEELHVQSEQNNVEEVFEVFPKHLPGMITKTHSSIAPA